MNISVAEHAPLAPFTTLGIGGPARFLIRAESEGEVSEALEFAEKLDCPVFVLGGGSNLLVSDRGFAGLVIKVELAGIHFRRTDASLVEAAAGEEFDSLVKFCVERNLEGLECLSGIPGTVGGAPIQNIGAYGREAGEVISSVRVLDRKLRRFADLNGPECRFEYRSSVFNTMEKDRYIVLKVEFRLQPGGKPVIRYEELLKHLGRYPFPPSLKQVRETVLDIREKKGMVVGGNDPDSRSAGSFFRNPVLTPAQLAEAEEWGRASGALRSSEQIPSFAAPSEEVKVPAAWLIERSGFHKGYSHGKAGISGKHALALVNLGGATAQDILDLMHLIQERVEQKFRVQLQPEPVFVGF